MMTLIHHENYSRCPGSAFTAEWFRFIKKINYSGCLLVVLVVFPDALGVRDLSRTYVFRFSWLRFATHSLLNFSSLTCI